MRARCISERRAEIRPKPMIEIGGRPIIWHIMKHYAHYGLKEFYIALGHRGEVIKRFFVDYSNLGGNLSVDLGTGQIDKHDSGCEDWIIHLRETGQESNTGERVRQMEQSLRDGTFMLTYGDGVCNLDLRKLLEFHRSHGRLATVTAVRPPARFGGLIFEGDLVTQFVEKPQIGEGWINGGVLVFETGGFDYFKSDGDSLGAGALQQLPADRPHAPFPPHRVLP